LMIAVLVITLSFGSCHGRTKVWRISPMPLYQVVSSSPGNSNSGIRWCFSSKVRNVNADAAWTMCAPSAGQDARGGVSQPSNRLHLAVLYRSICGRFDAMLYVISRQGSTLRVGE